MSQTFKLYRLQQLDSQLDRAQSRLREIEIALGQNEALIQAEQHADETAAKLQAERKALQKAERDVQDQRVKIEQTEATLYGGKVRNPKELQDLQNEVAALKRHRGVLEDHQLEAMIRIEEVEATHQESLQLLEEVRSKFAQQQQELIAEQASLAKELAQLEVERQAAAVGISPEDLALYNQLRQNRRGIAVVKVTDKACSACGSVLNAMLLQAARSPNQIARCDTCGRILYLL